MSDENTSLLADNSSKYSSSPTHTWRKTNRLHSGNHASVHIPPTQATHRRRRAPMCSRTHAQCNRCAFVKSLFGVPTANARMLNDH